MSTFSANRLRRQPGLVRKLLDRGTEARRHAVEAGELVNLGGAAHGVSGTSRQHASHDQSMLSKAVQQCLARLQPTLPRMSSDASLASQRSTWHLLSADRGCREICCVARCRRRVKDEPERRRPRLSTAGEYAKSQENRSTVPQQPRSGQQCPVPRSTSVIQTVICWTWVVDAYGQPRAARRHSCKRTDVVRGAMADLTSRWTPAWPNVKPTGAQQRAATGPE